METLRRIVALIGRPATEWDRIAAEPTSVAALLLRYILPLALPAPIATVVGMSTFDRSWDPVHGYLVPAGAILPAGAATFVAIVGSIFALAAVFAAIAPMFGGARNYVAALKVATYGAIPVLLAGATLLLPVMAMLGIVGLCHSLFLFFVGAGRVLGVADRDRAEFVGISMVLMTLLSVAAGALAGAAGLF